jgi:hypothetical protein
MVIYKVVSMKLLVEVLANCCVQLIQTLHTGSG